MSNVNNEKSEDKKDIEVEEREKMLNASNKALGKETNVENVEEKKSTKDIKEGMEVKPKKIPIGGIQMPGFFTRSKSKERCKEDGDNTEQEGTDLIDKNLENKDDNINSQAKIKLPNPFRKSKIDDEVDKPAETKKKLLDTIKLPLVSVFPKKKKEGETLENQTAQAELASMETLDEKSSDDKNNEMKNIALDDKKDVEGQNLEKETSWKDKVKTYKIAISALLVFLSLIIIIIFIAISGNQVSNSPPIKDGKFIEAITSCGKIEGLLEDSAFAFRGIPYARPPLGDLRFKYAQPLNRVEYCWNDTFLAHNATDLCLQILSNGTVIGDEDCLTLDVITPFVRYENPLPVIVLIGAESLMGGSPGKMRPSARFARSRDVVFVRPNFRLGALGFLALEVLSKSDYPKTSGNYGLSDILTALKWVQLNIEHFGGDPKSVTLWGHRAGATLVTALSTIRDAHKYFARAWASSGGALYPKKPLAESEIDNKSFLNAVQCEDAECLRQMEAEELVTAVEDTWRKPHPDLPSKDENPSKRHQWLVIDGKIIREDLLEVWKNNENLPAKLVLGSTAHSGSSQKLLMKHKHWTEDLVKQHVKESFLSEKNLTHFALERYPHTYKGLCAMISDIRIVCPLYAITNEIATSTRKVHFYVVNQTRFEQDTADIDSDVDAILGRYEPKTPEQKRYVSAIQSLFYNYVWHGKFEPDMLGSTLLMIGQDIAPEAIHSNCIYWIMKDVALTYAALD